MTRFELGIRLAFVALTAALLPFCGGRASDSGSSESHFLVPCDSTCAPGLSCVCGVCTEPCESDDACSPHGTRAVCAPSTCDGPTVTACDVLCTSSADCGALGSSYECSAGRCREKEAGGGRCDDPAGAVRDFVAEQKGCSVDGDCVKVSTPCFNEEICAGVVSIRTDHDAAALDGLLSDLASCSGECSACTLAVGPVACVAGICGFGTFDTPLSCDERSAEASDVLGRAVEAADRSCTTTADCTGVSDSTTCHYACGAIVSEAGALEVQRTIDELESGICATFEQDGCQAFPPPCPFPGDPACIAGQCVPDVGRAFGEPCSSACGECYVPGTGGAGICSAQCTDDTDCEPTGVCQRSGGTGKWCFRRCVSDAECRSVNGSTQNPLYCAERTDPESDSGYAPLTGAGEGFCIQASEP